MQDVFYLPDQKLLSNPSNKGSRQIVWQSKAYWRVLHAEWNPTWLDFPLIFFHVQQGNGFDYQYHPLIAFHVQQENVPDN